MDYLTLIIKPTHACNAACVYCSAWKEEYPRLNMSLETLEILFKRLGEQGKRGLRGVVLTWHGGEPLLMPLDFYRRAKQLQDELLIPTGMEVNNVMQSNLLAYTPDKAEFFREFLTQHDGTPGPIGTSFDLVGGIRVMKSGDYSRRFRQSVDTARSVGQPLGLVYTVHRYSLDKVQEIYQCLSTEFSDMPTRFNPVYAEGRGGQPDSEEYHITPEQYGRFMVEFYRLWADGGRKQRYDPFSAWHEYHYDRICNNMCCEESGDCSSTHLGMDTDGTIYSCGRGIDRGSQPLGNLHRQDLAQIMKSPFRTNYHNRTTFLRMTACRNCGWWRYCHGGCYVDSEIIFGDPFRPTIWCQSYQYFFKEVFGSPARETQKPVGPENNLGYSPHANCAHPA
jgi:radical SAM protein with 4Fe4S-binding SPASM domain